ncbi:MAG: c-type cytochrome [Aureispira sp.]
MKVINQKMLLFLLILGTIIACQDDGLLSANNNIDFRQQLSEYDIYDGALSALNPTAAYYDYKLNSSFFKDHAEKQRLISIPVGSTIKKVDDGLPEFPDGTVLVKTFYYYKDVRDPAKGKKIVETRLLIKKANQWNVGTYLWDDHQKDAQLVTGGFNKMVNFIDVEGKPQVIAYQLPSNRACASCHNVNEVLSPIGPKLRNLHTTIPSAIGPINQLSYFQGVALLDLFDVSTVGTLPDYQDTNYSLEERARAYMDINCAHCHDAKGSSPDLNMFYSYALSLEDTKIMEHKESIISNMVEGSMPQIGTSVIDEEGAELIEAYINSL